MSIMNYWRIFLMAWLLPVLAAMGLEEQGDPFTGNYKGQFVDAPKEYFFTIDKEWFAQVYPLGGDMFRVRLLRTLLHRGPVIFEVDAKATGDALSFDAPQTRGKLRNGRLSGEYRYGDRWVKFDLEKYELVSPTLKAAPPTGAVVLFDGTSLDGWLSENGIQDPPAALENGNLVIMPHKKGKPANGVMSKHKFEDAFVHIEFRNQYEPEKRGQGRSNSGVFLQRTDEVQVLDSFGLEGYWDECGSLYRVAAPKMNMCLPPLKWQTYDIIYRAPRFDDDGKLLEPSRVTVYHNGYRIHHEQVMPTKETPERRALIPGPLSMQDHGHPIRYRNIWLVELNGGMDDAKARELIDGLGLIDDPGGK